MHNRIIKNNDKTKTSIIIFQNNINHYFIVYENIQLFDEKNKIAKLQRIVNELELCKIDINKFEKLILKIKIIDMSKSKQSTKLFLTLFSFFVILLKVKLVDKSKQSTKSFLTLFNFFFIFKKIRKVKLVNVNKSNISKTKTLTSLRRSNDIESKNETTKSFVDDEVVTFSSVAKNKKKVTILKTMSKKIKIEIKTNKFFLLITIEKDYLRTIVSFFDFEFRISFNKNLFYTNAMIRNLKFLFNIVAFELYDSFNKNAIRKLNKKFEKFKIKYDFDLKLIYHNDQVLFNSNLKIFFESNSNRFRNITKKFQNKKQKIAM